MKINKILIIFSLFSIFFSNDSKIMSNIAVAYFNLNNEKEAEKYGVLQLFTVCGDIHMSKIHRDLGWDMSPAKHEAFKYLTNNLKKIDKNYG